MSDSQLPSNQDSLDRDRLIDSICDEFERLYLVGERPQIEAFLDRVDGLTKQSLLYELVAIDMHHRRSRNESIPIAEYQARFPSLSAQRLDATSQLSLEQRSLGLSNKTPETDPPTLDTNGQPTPVDIHEFVKYFGDYEILSTIARGGMGVVYKAKQLSLNRLVALKMILSGEFASQQEIDRFYSEAKSAALLDHPGIVPIFEVGEHNGRHFFSMTYVEGLSLDAKLNDGPLDPLEATKTMFEIAQAVQYAHERGVIHRDLKPSNILLDLQGHPRITDFGLAKQAKDGSNATVTGQVLGTPSYMPPEQAIGKLSEIGPSSDVYALGGVLYAALSGRPPFHAATGVETLKQVLENDPVPLCQLNAAIPRDLETIAQKCLEKSIAKRYATASELADELGRVMRGEPIHARRVTVVEHMWRWCLRNPQQATLSFAVSALTLCLVIGLPFTFAIRSELLKARVLKRTAETDQQSAEDLLLKAKEQGRILQIRTHFGNAIDFRRSRAGGQRIYSLAELRKAAELHPTGELRNELRTHVIGSLILPDLCPSESLSKLPIDVRFSRVDELKKVWAYCIHGVCHVHRFGIETEWFQVSGDLCELNSSGTALLTHMSDTKRCECYDLRANDPRKSTSLETCQVAIFDALEDQFIVAFSTGEMAMYNAFLGKRIKDLGTRISEAGFTPHPSGLVMAKTGDAFRSTQIWSLETNQLMSEIAIPNRESRIAFFVWNPNGKELAVSEMLGYYVHLYDYDPMTQSLHLRLSILGKKANSNIKYNRIGSCFVTWGWGAPLELFETQSGRQLVQSVVSDRSNMNGYFSDSGEEFFGAIASDNQHIGSWSVNEAREMRAFNDSKVASDAIDPIEDCCIHPNGQFIVSLSQNGRLAFYHLPTSRFMDSWQIARRGGRCTFNSQGELVTSTDLGVLHWPVVFSQDASNRLDVGPPKRLPINVSFEEMAIDRSGQYLAIASRNGTRSPGISVFNFLKEENARLFADGDLATVQFSMDNKWLSIGEHMNSVSIWDFEHGNRVQEICNGSQHARFTPDGKWIGVQSDGNRLFSVGDWRPGPQLGEGRLAEFSADSRFAILITDHGDLRLVEMDSFTEIGRLEHPDKRIAAQARFSPDGRYVVSVFNNPAGELFTWDLNLIRQGLKEFGLEEGWPHFVEPIIKPSTDEVPKLTLHINGIEVIEQELQGDLVAISQSLKLVNDVQAGNLNSLEQTASELVRMSQARGIGDVLYNVACAYSLASEKSDEKRKEYGDTAIAYLIELFEQGYFKPKPQRTHVKTDQDLMPLANRAAFAEFLKRVNEQR